MCFYGLITALSYNITRPWVTMTQTYLALSLSILSFDSKDLILLYSTYLLTIRNTCL